MDAQQNMRRCQLLAHIRWGLFCGIPPDTTWYEVRYLRNDHFDELRVMRESNWTDPADENELRKVAARHPFVLRAAPSTWQKKGRIVEYYSPEPERWQNPVLWGHNSDGPFTILEGTHRLVGYCQSEEHPELEMVLYIGLSANLCKWHLPDGRDVAYPVNALSVHVMELGST